MNDITIEIKKLREKFWTIEVNGVSMGWAHSFGAALSMLEECQDDIPDLIGE